MKKSLRNRVVLFAALSVSLIACKDKQTNNLFSRAAERDFLLHPISPSGGREAGDLHFTMLEIVDVRGICYEDHARRPDSYAGQIIRWQVDETKDVSTFGFVTKRSPDLVPLNQPQDAYHAPPVVDFRDIQIDTKLPKWTLHGVSSSEEDEDEGMDTHSHGFGYDSTCELEVVKRAPGIVSHEDLKKMEEGLR